MWNTYSRQFVMRVILLEGGLVGVAVIWGWLQAIPWHNNLTPTLTNCGAGVLAGLILLALNYVIVEYGSRYNAYFRTLKQLIDQDVSPIFRHIVLPAVIFIAIISGVAEEIFFRGVLQAQFGLWLASAMFGLAHVWRKAAFVYGVYAAIIGVFFGLMYRLSGNLWVPILAHVVNNFFAIVYYTHRAPTPTSSVRGEQRERIDL
ncbi:CPBP family intramembrane metalloprotease [candidate division KSB3 bacterium]|uniref:CPBP family intramembrane metalloprotease n=1 Tax=candidate division KSB3 bacterium TaxID=2044937 RepID=A0A9D5JUZ2_9BACT|nr:CPBP family intramembrane metalloprotease [candidate division KSB3 bacterium]MBD3324146.1 CPBP family intramembrane metalloprotease [candidate division KSB3 bacterium]